jgi:hypothetical protein
MNKKEELSISGGITEAIAAIIFGIVFYILLNRYYPLVPFLTENFQLVLPLLNISIFVSIIINATRIFITHRLYKALGELVITGFFVLVAAQLWIFFPIDTQWFGNEESWNLIFRILLIVPPLLAVLATTIELIKAFSYTIRKGD